MGGADPAQPAHSREDRVIPPEDETAPLPSASSDGWLLGGRYRVLDRIGVGGMAEVFRARDEMLDREVAVKVFRAQAPMGDSTSERQQTELHALARLNHPNLITLFDGSLTGTHEYLVMELVDGPSLSARIKAEPVAELQVREIGAQVADALAYVHAQGMVHRDVKPANILLGTDPTIGDMTVRARLSDFGIVRLLDTEHITRVDLTIGTASYLSPEQARGSDVGPASDVYSLALTLLEALTGARAYDEGGQIATMLARLDRAPTVPDGLPAPWPRLLRAMTAYDPANRPTAKDVAHELRGTGTYPIALAPAVDPNAATSFAPRAGGFGAAGGTAVAPAGFGALGGAAAAGGVAGFGGPGNVAPPPLDAPLPAAAPPQRRANLIGWLAAVVVLGLIVLGAFALFGGSDSPSGGVPTTSTSVSTSAPSPSRASTTERSSSATTSSQSSSSSSTSSEPSSPPSTSSSSSSSSASSSSSGSSSSSSSSSSNSSSSSSSSSSASTSTSDNAGASGPPTESVPGSVAAQPTP